MVLGIIVLVGVLLAISVLCHVLAERGSDNETR